MCIRDSSGPGRDGRPVALGGPGTVAHRQVLFSDQRRDSALQPGLRARQLAAAHQPRMAVEGKLARWPRARWCGVFRQLLRPELPVGLWWSVMATDREGAALLPQADCRCTARLLGRVPGQDPVQQYWLRTRHCAGNGLLL